MLKDKLAYFIATSILFTPLHSTEYAENFEESGYTINFPDVAMLEFIRFVSKVADVNFIFDEKKIDFNISLVSNKSATSDNVLNIMIELLNQNGFRAKEQDGYYLIEEMNANEKKQLKRSKLLLEKRNGHSNPIFSDGTDEFCTYKLQYNQGADILKAIKDIALGFQNNENKKELFHAIQSMQWIEQTNSLLITGEEDILMKVVNLIRTVDIPAKQVFIEVLVIETDVKNGMEFGLQWAGGGKYKDEVGFGIGNFPASTKPAHFASTIQGINPSNRPTGADQIPLGSGFDLGVIGDIILHKGKTFFSLGSLVSALQVDGNSTIVLNQKLLAQDNKNSVIFVGDNIPFAGSIIETVGSTQQTTANIEYRDVGVSLNITPLIGSNNTVTLDISEEITEATNQLISTSSALNGIQTTKTNMLTRAHVPDKKFLILSGMIRNSKTHRRTGIPCLGGLPLIGAAFSKTVSDDAKRNIIIFVRPQIIHSNQEHEHITASQEALFKNQSPSPKDFDNAVQIVNPK